VRRYQILWVGFLIVFFALSCARKEVAEHKVVTPVPGVKKAAPKEKMPEELRARPIEEAKIREEELARERMLKEEALKEEIAAFEEEDIHFDFDKYNIRPDAAEILKKKAEWLKEHPNVHVLIEGHCDERGTEEYNLALGERRANSTKQFLIGLGVDASCISTISYGEERPIDPRHNEEAWAKNRRCHFVVTKY